MQSYNSTHHQPKSAYYVFFSKDATLSPCNSQISMQKKHKICELFFSSFHSFCKFTQFNRIKLHQYVKSSIIFPPRKISCIIKDFFPQQSKNKQTKQNKKTLKCILPSVVVGSSFTDLLLLI